jgi:hypothetical protein
VEPALNPSLGLDVPPVLLATADEVDFRFWHKADVTDQTSDVRFQKVKRTLLVPDLKSEFDPDRTWN